MSDVVVLAIVVVAFATLVTAHVAIVHGLSRRKPRWRALVAFAVPPLAPYWGFRDRMRVRSAIWIGGASLYVVARVFGAT